MGDFEEAPLPPLWLERAELADIRKLPAGDPTRGPRLSALYAAPLPREMWVTEQTTSEKKEGDR